MSERKSKVKLRCSNGVWTASTVFYGTEMYSCASSVSGALHGLKFDMHYVEFNLYQAVMRMEDKS